MEIRSFALLAASTLFSISPSVFAFEYFEDFERYESGADFSKGYNREENRKTSVKYYAGISTKLVSINDKLHAIDETVPAPAINPRIETSDPSKLRTGDCVNCVMQFINSGSADLDEDSWAEQRFELDTSDLPAGENGLSEVWMQYDQYIPENYHHRETEPDKSAEFGGQRKVISLFGDVYSGKNGVIYPTFIMGASMQRGRNPVVNASYVDLTFSTQNPKASPGSKRFFQVGVGQKKMLIDPEYDKGHWQRRTVHIRMPTSEDAEDGVIEAWVQRQSETDIPMAPEKLIDVSNGNFYDSARNYINKGYLLGWSNAGYNYDVTILIDNLILSTYIQSVDSSAIVVDNDRKSRPNPPNVKID